MDDHEANQWDKADGIKVFQKKSFNIKKNKIR